MAFTEHQNAGQAEPRQNQHGCEAYGCPLPGTISAASGPGATYYCRHHFTAAPSDLQVVTNRIRQNLRLIQHCRVMELLASDAYFLLHSDCADQRYRAYSWQGYEKDPAEDHWSYVHRLQAAVNLVLAGKPANWNSIPHRRIEKAKPDSRKGGETWQGIGEFIPESIAAPELPDVQEKVA